MALYELTWELCTVDERDKIVRDVSHFFAPAIEGDVSEPVDKSTGEFEDDSEDDGAAGGGAGETKADA